MSSTRNTIQKEITYSTLMQMDHPTADEVYERIRKEHPTIAKATVFRNLSSLVEQGKIVRIQKVGSQSYRYDGNLRKHHHGKCTSCGRAFDIFIPDEAEEALEKAALITDPDFEVKNRV